jgi:F-type H+-transporting ATPase subunit gamma
MANLKALRSRITSVKSTKQITSAMKMVSAAKLSKAQEAIENMRPYAEKLTEIIQNLSATMEGEIGSELAKERDGNRTLVIALSSNRGLAGAFNANIVKKVNKMYEHSNDQENFHVACIGKKASDVLKKQFDLVFNENEIYDNLDFEHTAVIAEDLMEKFTHDEYDRIVLVYNQFKNAATQIIQEEQFLPIVPPEADKSAVANQDYIFEPDKKEILEDLMPKSLKIQLFKALRDSFASEHGARMTAMHKATENATELSEDLNLEYNKARQASITNEILEIVAGAEALAD